MSLEKYYEDDKVVLYTITGELTEEDLKKAIEENSANESANESANNISDYLKCCKEFDTLLNDMFEKYPVDFIVPASCSVIEKICEKTNYKYEDLIKFYSFTFNENQ